MEPQHCVVFSEVIDVNEERTSDVISDGSFKSLLLAQSTLDNLNKHGFKKPSPVQMKAIPPGMAGKDMLVQAKSGTGKTLVFAILAAENLKLSSKAVQKLVIAPTREIALQIGETIQKLSPKGTRIAVLTGGTSVHEDKEKLKRGVHIVVGTTGRLCQMVNEDSLNLSSLSLFILDEADKMMSGTFEKDVNFLYSCVPSMRQVAVFSATYPPHLASSLTSFLRSPIHVRLNANDVQLVGVKQYVSLCFAADPVEAVITAFTSIQFKQAFLFCNKAEECPLIAARLVKMEIEAAAISAQLEQSQREDVIKRLKANKIKVLVSTDLTARGVDADNVDLVINIDTPFEVETYFHRIGRAARYGGQGASLTILPTKKSLDRFSQLAKDGGIKAKAIQLDAIAPTLTTDRTFFDACPLFVSDIGKGRQDRRDRDKDCLRQDDVDNKDTIENGRDQDEEAESASDFSELLDKNEVVMEEKEKPEEKKKFKFVPSRSKNSTKYYMKGEMISIRDAFTRDQWKEYAAAKFDMTKEPFIKTQPENKSIHEGKNTEKWERGKSVTPPLQITTASCSRDGIKEYTRKDLIAISKSKPVKVWRAYASSQWDLKEDPFVEDQSMRCSFTDRLRLQRQKEKVERDKVVAERNAARLRLISMGTTVSVFKEWEGSFEEYCDHMKNEMEKTRGGLKRGAVVSRRRGKEEYRRKVDETRKIMERVEKNYEYTLNAALNGIKEGGIQTEMEIGIDDPKKDDAVIVATQEVGKVDEKEEEEEKERDADEEWPEEEKEQEYEEEEEEEEAEYEEGEGDVIQGIQSNSLGIEDSIAHSQLFSSYNRNIEFARVFNAYLSSMNTLR